MSNPPNMGSISRNTDEKRIVASHHQKKNTKHHNCCIYESALIVGLFGHEHQALRRRKNDSSLT